MTRDEGLRQLIAAWREKAREADRLATQYEGGGDYAGNAHAFRKERRIWTTCADELEALLVPSVREPLARRISELFKLGGMEDEEFIFGYLEGLAEELNVAALRQGEAEKP